MSNPLVKDIPKPYVKARGEMMNTTEDERATCGSTLEQVRPGKWQCPKCELDSMLAAEYNKGYQAGFADKCDNDDYAFWLRQYAGQAMQGMLAQGDHINDEGGYHPNGKGVIVEMAADYANALLEEVKKHD